MLETKPFHGNAWEGEIQTKWIVAGPAAPLAGRFCLRFGRDTISPDADAKVLPATRATASATGRFLVLCPVRV